MIGRVKCFEDEWHCVYKWSFGKCVWSNFLIEYISPEKGILLNNYCGSLKGDEVIFSGHFIQIEDKIVCG